MKVSGPGGASPIGGPRGAASSSAAPGFSPAASTSAATESSPTSGLTSIGSLEALMALQEVGGPLERRRRAANRGGRILDALDAVKLGLLAGGLTRTAVEGLTQAVREQRSMTDDPNLESLLDEIETRAAVEMAKLESLPSQPGVAA